MESYERIHRSNLIGMGVLPLQFPDGETAESLGLDGTETFDISGVTALNDGSTPRTVHVTATKDGGETVEFDARGPHRHPRRGRLLPQRRDHAVRAAGHAAQLTPPEELTALPRTLLTAGARISGHPPLLVRCLDEAGPTSSRLGSSGQ